MPPSDCECSVIWPLNAYLDVIYTSMVAAIALALGRDTHPIAGSEPVAASGGGRALAVAAAAPAAGTKESMMAKFRKGRGSSIHDGAETEDGRFDNWYHTDVRDHPLLRDQMN